MAILSNEDVYSHLRNFDSQITGGKEKSENARIPECFTFSG